MNLITINFVCFVLIFFFTSCSSQRRSKRDKWQKPELIFSAIAAGKNAEKSEVFCDLGAGEGYFTLKASNKYKHIYASDIDQRKLGQLFETINKRKIKNISPVLSKLTDPLFPLGKCDVLFMALVYHHLEDRINYLKNLKKYLSEKGRIINLDNSTNIESYSGTGKRLPAKECRFSKQTFISEAKQAGFSYIKEHKVLPMQYLIELK